MPAWFVQKKYDGVRVQIHKDGDKVLVVTEDGTDVTDRLPGTIEEVKKLKDKRLVLDAEVERWDGPSHLPREAASGYLNAQTDPDDSDIIANIFDVMLTEKEGDIHKLSTHERLKRLTGLGIKQSTMEAPSLKGRLNAAPGIKVNDLEELEKVTRMVRELPGSEGVVVKQADSVYPLEKEAVDVWVKYHNASLVRGIVQGRTKVKDGGWVYQWAVLPGKDDPAETATVDGKKVVSVGDTFTTKLDYDEGDPILVEVEQLNLTRTPEGIEITGWVPRVIGDYTGKADTVDAAVARAKKDLVLRVKKVDEEGEVSYVPVVRVLKQADPYMEIPDEEKSYRYAASHHFRGKSLHADVRIGFRPGKLLVGWTMNTQIAGVVKEPVVTLAQARAWARRMDDVSKINWNTGEWAERAKRGAKKPVRVEILCFAPMTEIMTVEGFKPIMNINEGDRVLTVSGEFQCVTGKFRRPAPRRLIEIKAAGVPCLRTTLEHKFYVIPNPSVKELEDLSRSAREEHFTKLRNSEPQWIPATDLRSGDYMVCPKPKLTPEVSTLELATFQGYKKPIEVTPEFLRFVGFWIGDGDGVNGQVVRLHFNGRTERALAEEYSQILEKIGCRPRVRHRDPSRLLLQLHDAPLASWLVENCGSGALQKTLPEQWLGLDSENWFALWRGLVESDGWREGGREFVSTISKRLAGRVAQQFTFLGLPFSYRLRTQLGKGKNRIYELRSSKPGDRHWLEHPKGILRRVTSVEEFSKNDPHRGIKEVINIEVGKDPTFTAHLLGTHNCERKSPEPWPWIDVEGKTKDPEPGKPPPVGGTRQYPGVFHIVDQGGVESGAQKPWLHEHFFHGDALNYRMFWRQLRLGKLEKARHSYSRCIECGKSAPVVDVLWADGRGRAWFCAKCYGVWLKRMGGRKKAEVIGEKKILGGNAPPKFSDVHKRVEVSKSAEPHPATVEIEKQRKILPPSEAPPAPGYDEPSWLAIYPDDQTPYVLDKDAVEKSWMPPLGKSALPRAVRGQVPKEHRYWTRRTIGDARKARDALVAAVKAGDVELDYAAPYRTRKASMLDADFVLQEQTWRGPVQIRVGPSRTLWRLLLDVGRPSVVELRMMLNPLDNEDLTLFMGSARKGSMDVSGPIKPGHYLNPTKATPSNVSVLDKGKAEVLSMSKDFIKVRLAGKRLKGLYAATRNNEEWLWTPAQAAPETDDIEKRAERVASASWFVPIIKIDKEKRLVTGIVLEPGEVDAQNDTVSEEIIEKACHKFLAHYNDKTRLGIMHKAFGDIGLELAECWTTHEPTKINGQKVKKGSWLMTAKVTTDARWKKVKRGEYAGWSIGGVATV